MIKYLTFDNIMAFVRLFTLGAGIIVMIKQRSDIIIARYKQRKAEAEAQEWKTVAMENKKDIKFIADTQLDIVQASKMATEDKTRITRNYVNLFEHKPEVEVEVETSGNNNDINIVQTITETIEVVKEVGRKTGLLDEN